MERGKANILVVLTITLITVLTGLMGCKSVRYVEVERQVRDSVYIERLRVDSVSEKDSVYIRSASDTVWMERWNTRNRFVFLHDTISVLRVDSVRVPYPVEKDLSTWQKVRLRAFNWLLGLFAAVVCFLAYKTIKNKS